MAMDERTWRIGEVATATGLTVRALHHYDQIGLVVPSARTSGGHRLYTDADLAVLYQVTALRQLGGPLDQVAVLLDGRATPRAAPGGQGDRRRRRRRSLRGDHQAGRGPDRLPGRGADRRDAPA